MTPTTELSRADEAVKEPGKALLLAVRERLADETRWTKGYYAHRADGRGTTSRSPTATCWCLVGAAEAEDDDIWASGDHRQFARLLGFSSPQAMVNWNDAPERTHAEVLARLDAAIEVTP